MTFLEIAALHWRKLGASPPLIVEPDRPIGWIHMNDLSNALSWASHMPDGSLDRPRSAPPARGLGEDFNAQVTDQMGKLGDRPQLVQAYSISLYALSDRPGVLRSFVHQVGRGLDVRI